MVKKPVKEGVQVHTRSGAGAVIAPGTPQKAKSAEKAPAPTGSDPD